MRTMERVARASFMTHLQGSVLPGLKASEGQNLGPSPALPAGSAKNDPVMSIEGTASR
jgi:hypothetical protein